MSCASHEWSTVKLRDVATSISYGFTVAASFGAAGPRMLRITDIQNNRVDWSTVPRCECSDDRFALRAGDIVIARTGATTGKSFLIREIGEPAVFASYLIRVRASARVLPEYLSVYMASPEYWSQITVISKGTAQPGANASILGELDLPLPPIAEQRRIVAKLEALQARSRRAREALDAIPQLLEKLRQSILAAAFRGDLTKAWRAQNPDVEPASELLKKISKPPAPSRAKSKSIAVRPGDCGLSIGNPKTPGPRGWEWVPLIDVARLESGHTPSRLRSEWWGGAIPWMGIKDARDHHGRTTTKTLQTTNAEGLANSAARLLPKGTVCLTRTATIGYVTVMGEDMATSQDFANWVCTEAVEPHWLMWLLIAEKQALLRYSSQSTNVATIFYPELLAFHVCLPPPDEQREIVRGVERLMAWTTRLQHAHEKGAERLGLFTSSTLAKAFRGELVMQAPAVECAEKPAYDSIPPVSTPRKTMAPPAKRGRGRAS